MYLKKGKNKRKRDSENEFSDEEGQAYGINCLNLGKESNESRSDLD